jgi:hypothetical protein
MIIQSKLHGLWRVAGLLAAMTFVAMVTFIATPAIPAAAQERVEISAEFRTALEPYGSFRRHDRWGEVWVPGNRERDWRPYTVGKWIYSEDYGWFWQAADEEAVWGAVVYHYGRWVYEIDIGWVWIPDKIWGPSWVTWRHGRGARKVIGWAPLPPEEIIVEVRDEPRYWVFVEPRALVSAEIIARVALRTEPVLLQETEIVSRTVVVQRERAVFAVAPGLPPSYMAAEAGAPIPAFRVRPRVLAGTFAPPGAMAIRAEELRAVRGRAVTSLQSEIRQARQIAPSRSARPPEPLTDPRQIRLGADGPRAAQGAQVFGASVPSNATPISPAAQRRGQGSQEHQQGQQRPGLQQPGQQQGQQQEQQRPQPQHRQLRRPSDQRQGARGGQPGPTGLAPDRDEGAGGNVPDNRRNSRPGRDDRSKQTGSDRSQRESAGSQQQREPNSGPAGNDRSEGLRPEPRRDTVGSGGRGDRESGGATKTQTQPAPLARPSGEPATQPGRDQRSMRSEPGAVPALRTGAAQRGGPPQQGMSRAPAQAAPAAGHAPARQPTPAAQARSPQPEGPAHAPATTGTAAPREGGVPRRVRD